MELGESRVNSIRGNIFSSLKKRQEMMLKRCLGLHNQLCPIPENGIKVTKDPLWYSSVNINLTKVRLESMPLLKVLVYESIG